MINRTIIRLKIVQLMYSYYQNGGKNMDTAEKELLFSLSKAYDLYHFMLMLMPEVTHFAFESIEQREQVNRFAHREENISHRFVDNKFVEQLDVNHQLKEFRENQKLTWRNHNTYLKNLYADIQASDAYKEYMEAEEVGYAEDRELWRRLYKTVIMKDERIDEILEDMSLYWNDDREIVDTFVLKTIKRFDLKRGAKQDLLPEYKDEEDREYAVRLFRNAILNELAYRDLIMQSLRNWEFDRLAFMDVIIMQVAMAEVMTFPNIPTSVTINEYVEIAKLYSTGRSGGYINGIIDNVVKRLKAEGKILKE
ncbi:MAG: transcription antitermination factor NusB [Prevotellaceae bacterium]|nr:transcription antitermination factor NusB [Prevotellaceae bacterium]